MKTMAVIKCKFVKITNEFGGNRLVCLVADNTPANSTVTSDLKMVDFERKMAITQNNIYRWE